MLKIKSEKQIFSNKSLVKENEHQFKNENKPNALLNYQNCPICLCNFNDDALISSPDICEHIFCLECIQEWSKKVNTCPIDRQVYNFIIVKNSNTLAEEKRIKVEDRTKQLEIELQEDLTYCEVCRQPNREDRMLLCDSCDKGYHCECLVPALEDIPEGEWFCPICIRSSNVRNLPTSSANINAKKIRLVARTNLYERVRRNVTENRRTRNSIENNLVFPTTREIIKRKKNRKVRKVKRISKRPYKRKVKRKKSSCLKIKKETEKMDATVTSKTTIRKRRKYKTKRRRKRRIRKIKSIKSADYRINQVLKLNVLNIKKKYKLTNKTSKERIIKRIIGEHEKKIIDYNTKKFGVLSNIKDRNHSLDDHDSESIELTANTSHYFDELNKKSESYSKFEVKSVPTFDFLNSIISSQQLLTMNSSEIKLKHDGTLQLNKANDSEINKLKKPLDLTKHKTNSESLLNFNNKINEKMFNQDYKLHNKSQKDSQNNIRNDIQSDLLPCTSKDSNKNKDKEINKIIKTESITKIKIEKDQNEFLIQENIASICKQTLKPFYINKTLNKENYKMIMKKVVTKVKYHVKVIEMINPKKIVDLALAYVEKVKLEKADSKKK